MVPSEAVMRAGRLAPGMAFIFDMDGTMVDSNDLHSDAWDRYLAQQGVTIPDMTARMLGKRNDEIVVDFFGSHLAPEEVFQHGAAKEALYRDMMRPILSERILPGLHEFLERYADVPKGLATNAERPNVDFVLDEADLRRFFRVIIDGNQVQRPKPNPEVFLTTATQLGYDPRNCVIFEDSPAGLRAARDSGAWVVGVQSKHPVEQEADLIIEHFEDPRLEPWLCGLTPR